MQKGFLTRSPFFIARSIHSGEEPASLAIVASKKRVGSAVDRNRARRRLRAAANIAVLPAGHHVVVAHATSLTAPFEDLVRQLKRLEAR